MAQYYLAPYPAESYLLAPNGKCDWIVKGTKFSCELIQKYTIFNVAYNFSIILKNRKNKKTTALSRLKFYFPLKEINFKHL